MNAAIKLGVVIACAFFLQTPETSSAFDCWYYLETTRSCDEVRADNPAGNHCDSGCDFQDPVNPTCGGTEVTHNTTEHVRSDVDIAPWGGHEPLDWYFTACLDEASCECDFSSQAQAYLCAPSTVWGSEIGLTTVVLDPAAPCE